MFDIKRALSLNKLFKDFHNKEITDFLISSQYQTRDYAASQIIALEGDPLTQIGLLLSGKVSVEKCFPSGKKITISQLSAGDIFGEAIIFSPKKVFPSMVTAVNNCKVMFVDQEHVIKMCFQNEKFLLNLLQLLSEKILLMDYRLRFLSGESIRQKICLYLLEQYEEQKRFDIHLTDNREALAEQFGVTRPSLSRELNKMRKEGLINLTRKTIIINNLSLLEQNL